MSEMQEAFINLRRYMNTSIVGQGDLIDKMLVCLLGDGHLLVEGAPGLAKTKAIRKLAQAIECDAPNPIYARLAACRHYGQRCLSTRKWYVCFPKRTYFPQLYFGR